MYSDRLITTEDATDLVSEVKTRGKNHSRRCVVVQQLREARVHAVSIFGSACIKN